MPTCSGCALCFQFLRHRFYIYSISVRMIIIAARSTPILTSLPTVRLMVYGLAYLGAMEVSGAAVKIEESNDCQRISIASAT